MMVNSVLMKFSTVWFYLKTQKELPLLIVLKFSVLIHIVKNAVIVKDPSVVVNFMNKLNKEWLYGTLVLIMTLLILVTMLMLKLYQLLWLNVI
jgi:hypothetical protein